MAEFRQFKSYTYETRTTNSPVMASVRIAPASQQRLPTYSTDRLHSDGYGSLNRVGTNVPDEKIYKTELFINLAPPKMCQNSLSFSASAAQPTSRCHKCKEWIESGNQSGIKFNEQSYHVDCFTCTICRRQLNDSKTTRFAIDKNNEPMCSDCELAQSKVCSKCQQRILSGSSITFDLKYYHSDCLCCEHCRRSLAYEKNLQSYNDKAYCVNCYEDWFAPKCFECFKPISAGKIVTYDTKKYHEDCFRCGQCSKVLTEPEFYNHNAKPCCIRCYNEKFATWCAECSRAILVGRMITHDGKNFHPDCFRCGQCRRSMADEKTFHRHNEKPCCNDCFKRYVAPRCYKCSMPITDTYTTFQDKKFHPECFTCSKCRRKISSSEKFYDDKISILCLKCGT